MQVDSRWAEPAVADQGSVPFDVDHQPASSDNPISTTTTIITHSLSVRSSPQPSLTAIPSLFPPQRVEPVDMPRPHQQQQQQTLNRDKTGYIQSTTNDEQQTTTSYLKKMPIKHVTHPADQSAFVILLRRLSKIGFIIFISIPCVIIVTLILPISLLLRTFIRLTCRYHCTVTPCTCSYLSSSDLFWLYNSNTSINRNKNEETTKLNSQTNAPVAAAIFFLDGTINEKSLKKLLINRAVTNTSRRGSNIGHKIFPRFSQLIVSHFSGIMWIDYSAFSIDEHVREIPRNIQNDEDLQSYVSTLVSSELTLTRPLWQLHYKNRTSIRPNDSILIFLYHPILSDGISLIRILLKHIVDNRTTQLDLKPRFAGRHGEHIFDYLKAYLFGHMLLCSKIFFNSSRDNFLKRIILKNPIVNISTNNSNLSNQRQRIVHWSTPFSLTQANRMKLVTRTRMNDLLSTLVISCVRLYLEKHGLSNSENINCIMPCDLRSNTPNIVMGNHIAHLSLKIPINIEGNIPTLWSFNDDTKRMKQNGDYATMYLFNYISYLLFPISIANRLMARIYNNASLWLTTITAGSSTALATISICNRDVRSLICLNPSIGTHNINFCVTTYADEIRLAVIVDPNIIPDPQFFTECFNQQLNVIQDLLAHRRIPGEIRRTTRPQKFPLPKKSISSISDMSEDLTIEEIQSKMSSLQQELLSLKSQFENVDMTDPSSQTQRLIITTKLEELRREFRELLIKLQERQCELSGMIPSDEEDEMDPHVRVRLRSASVASKISLRSNEQRQMSKIYQLEKDSENEFSTNTIQNPTTLSKVSLAGQRSNESEYAGMRRAQSVSICENTRVDLQHQTSTSRTRPTTPSKKLTTSTNATIIHLDPSENWKHGSGH
ncbi:unnamed protein product [Adineta steineri]|uniref:O-acyltransferase WSD1 C-terminal domain-containing protein n=1 Tax=Adineta steineri TaxID=433720 RepID=A0A814KQ74_9BILA|nr:unnamed protein product [Adineta steineri]CAF3579886.1 unnamed protein product [Adineta steineri]